MNAIDILGSLLGKKGGGGLGGAILNEVIGGVMKKSQQPAQQRHQPQSSPRPAPGGGVDLDSILRDAHSRFQQRTRPPQAAERSQPMPGDITLPPTAAPSELDNERAVVLIRAMINAAKADGQLDQQEQEAILKQLGDVTQDEIQFVRSEFSSPFNVRDFAWSVPLGMEQHVYTMSLMAIQLDQDKEASYLRDLAHGLRLPPDTCNRIHQQYNAPLVFR